MYPEVLTEDLRRTAGDLVGRLGDRLGAEGYRGFFEVDVLLVVACFEPREQTTMASSDAMQPPPPTPDIAAVRTDSSAQLSGQKS
jgi:hypothetical protein